MKIEPNDVSLMLKLMPTLEVLEEGIRILGGQSYCSASSVLPFLVQFRNVLEQNEDDPVFISKFKQVLSNELSERCKENLNFSLLAKSSFFDKRFSKVGFLSKLEYPEGEEITKESMIAEVLEELEELTQDQIVPSRVVQCDTEPVSKKAKFLSSICDASDDDESAQNNAKEELERYVKEKTIGTKDDPLEWWKTKKHQYPLMSHLALKYLCIQAASTAAERAFSLLGNILTKKRTSLSDEQVNMLTYLSDCI